MRRVRPFVVLLMSLAVCLQGHAAVRVMDASCPMQHAHGAHVAAHTDAQAHNHGDDHHQGRMLESPGDSHHPGNAHHGSTHDCGGHLGCDPVSTAMFAVQPLPEIHQPIAQAPAGATPAFRSHTAFFLWRPPART